MSSFSVKWVLLASSSRLQRSSQILSVIGSHVFVFGGELLPREPIDNQIDLVGLDQADPEIGSKVLPAPSEAPSPRVGSAATAVDGSFYLFSGRGGVAMTPVEEHGAVWQYEPKSSKWALIKPVENAPYPDARSYHAMTSNKKDTLYMHAGCPESGRLSDFWSFNISTKVWTELASAPASGRGGTSIALFDDKIYRMNGFDGSTEQGGTVDIYDLKQNTWSSKSYGADGTQGPKPRSVGSLLAIKIDGKPSLVTLFGEGEPSDLGHAGAGRMFADCWLYDIAGDSWSVLQAQGQIPAPRGWFAADVAVDGVGKEVIVVHGGLAEDNSRLGDVWKLELK